MVDITKHLIYSYTCADAYCGTERLPAEEVANHKLSYLAHAVVNSMVKSRELHKLLRASATVPGPGFLSTAIVVLSYDDYAELLTAYERNKHAETSQETNK